MKWKRSISRGISEMFALASKLRGPRQGFRVLMYHSVNYRAPYAKSNDPFGIFTVNPQLFNIHIEALIECSYISLVSLTEGLTHISHNKLSVALTFDDGFKDNLYSVAPVLIKHRIPFIVFVTCGHLQKGEPDFLTPNELRELSKLPGVCIGAHGVTHTPFTYLTDSMLTNELLSSKQYLEDVIGKEVTTVSYPHGAVDLRVRNAVKKAGFKIGATSRIDVNNNLTDPLSLRRTVILASDSKRVFLQKLCGDWDWLRWYQR